MKVSKTGPGKSAPTVRQTKKTAGRGSAFAERLKEAAGVAEVSEAAESASVAAVESVLSVQESPDATAERSRGLVKIYGDRLLDRLEDIRHGLLIGAIPKENLAVLAQSMRAQRHKSDDPRLNEIIDEIELRAEVEIAKLTREA